MKQNPCMMGREKRHKTSAKDEGKNSIKQKPCIEGREKRHETKAIYIWKGKTA